MQVRPLDFAALVVTIGAVCLFAAAVYGGGKGGAEQVAVEGADGVWLFPADAEETVAVPGPLGDTVVRLNRGTVRVVSSPCTNQLCVAQGEIHTSGGWIACLPNRVTVTIRGKNLPVQADGGTW
jgi:hypothetical protein